MYFVDKKRIETILNHMEHVILFLEEESAPSHLKDQLAFERAVTVIIESIIDVGNQLIDGFIMRDPGGYEDIIDILFDENVVTVERAGALKAIIGYRKLLAYDYTNIEADQLYAGVKEHLELAKGFSTDVRAYLKNELGVITAFIPDEKEQKKE